MQTYSFIQHFYIAAALLRRDLHIMAKQLKNIFFDGIVLTVINVFVFGYLFPLAGMKQALILPVLFGSMLNVMISLSYSFAVRIVFDLHFNRFINYHLTLPLPKKWLFGQYIIKFTLELMLSMGPLFGLTIFFLRSHFTTSSVSWVSFITVLLAGMLLFSLLFLTFSISHPYEWFLDNIWPRRLLPLMLFGAIFYPWHAVYTFSPTIGYLFLLNPLTYIAEGMRRALLATDQFLPVWLCLLALLFFFIVTLIVFVRGIYKNLNPV